MAVRVRTPVTLTPPSDRAATGAVCASGGRALSSSVTATVGGPVRILVEGARAKEGKDASLDFAVTLNRAAPHDVSVDYAASQCGNSDLRKQIEEVRRDLDELVF